MILPYLTDYIFVSRGVMDPNFCRAVIENNKELDSSWQKHHWSSYKNDGTGVSVISESREEGELVVKSTGSDNDLTETLKKYIINSLDGYKNHVRGMAFNCFTCSTPRINRYLTGTNMASHHDSIISLFEKGTGVPVLSVVGVLNDDYEGGEFIMFDSMKIHLRAGDILIFPSAFMYTHEVTTVTKGERWSYVSWVV